MTSVTTVFDYKQIRRARDRAAPRLKKADFLLERAVDDICERLAGIQRQFNRAVFFGDSQNRLSSRLAEQTTLTPDSFIVEADLSQKMLITADRSKSKHNTIVYEEEGFPFAPASLDLVVSVLSLHKVNDLPGALIQIRQALKPDGLFIGCLFGGETLTELRQAFMTAELELGTGVSPHISPFADVRDLGSLLQRAGFALPVTDSDLVTVNYDTVFNLMDDLRAMGETNSLITRSRKPTKKSLMLKLAEIYTQNHTASNGRISSTFEILFCTAWSPAPNQQQPLKPGSAKTRLANALGTDEIALGQLKHEEGQDD